MRRRAMSDAAGAWAASLRERFPYELVSHWRVPGKIDAVFDVLTDAPSMPRWWPSAYARVSEIAPGDASGRGRTLAVVSRGALPYELVWKFEFQAPVRPMLLSLSASGNIFA